MTVAVSKPLGPVAMLDTSDTDTSGGSSWSVMVPTASSGESTTPPTGLSTPSIRNSSVSSCSSAVSPIVNTLAVAPSDPAGIVT